MYEVSTVFDTKVCSEVMHKGQQQLVRPISPNSPCDQELGVQSAALSADSIHAMPWELFVAGVPSA